MVRGLQSLLGTAAANSPAMTAKKNIAGMSKPHGESVEAQWTARGILLCLSFAMSLKAGAKLSDCLVDAARIFVRARWRVGRVA